MKVYILYVQVPFVRAALRYKVCDDLQESRVSAIRMHKNGLINQAWIYEGTLETKGQPIMPLEETGHLTTIPPMRWEYKHEGD